MAEVIEMPRLSDTMEEGVIAKWHKKVGDTIKPGDLLAEIETDKATMEFEAPVGGTLLYIGAEAGKAVPIGEVIAIIGKPGEDIQALLSGGGEGCAERTRSGQFGCGVYSYDFGACGGFFQRRGRPA